MPLTIVCTEVINQQQTNACWFITSAYGPLEQIASDHLIMCNIHQSDQRWRICNEKVNYVVSTGRSTNQL